MKLNIELRHYDITYHLRKAINGHALGDFVAKFIACDGKDEEGPAVTVSHWKLFVDGASNEFSSGARVVLETVEGQSIYYTLNI